MWYRGFAAAFVVLLALGAFPSADDAAMPRLVAPVGAQPDPGNATQPPATDQHPLVAVQAYAQETFIALPELGARAVPITIADYSAPGAGLQQTVTIIDCQATPLTEFENGWSAALSSSGGPLGRGQTMNIDLLISSGPLTRPEYVEVNVRCTGLFPPPSGLQEIGNLTITARVLPYYKFLLEKVGVPERVRPDQEFEYTMRLTNNGNQVTVFQGQVESPEGWELTVPATIVLDPGESTTFQVKGFTSRGKLWVPSESGLVYVTYAPANAPDRYQSLPIPVAMSGVYLHPALLPLIGTAVALIAVLAFLAVLARRAIEEQILGKPVPPWRIPVEREHLKALMRADADQFYIVRYYLMVEEHRSALLWFAAYKRATKKDRQRERSWVKTGRKQGRKIKSEEKALERFTNRWDRRVARVDRKQDRQLRVLEKKLRRRERKQQRKVDRKHRKRTKRLDKRHAKAVKKATKRHERVLAKQNKQIARENRRRAKRDEEPLPPPEVPAPELASPEAPERIVIESKPLEESRYAKRAERIRRRHANKKARKLARRDRLVAKETERTQRRVARLRDRIPPEPQTHLYDSQEYVPASEAIVEDDRTLLARLLHLPTLEEREWQRRRAQVYDARIRAAKKAGDEERVAVLQQAKAEERRHLSEARRQEALVQRASKKEDELMDRQRDRSIKRRARQLAKDAQGEAEDEAPATAAEVPKDEPGRKSSPRGGLRARLGIRRADREPPAEEETVPPAKE